MAYLNNDTICALATAPGGAMATIRVSGNEAITITDALFVSPTGHQLVDARSHTAHYGVLREGDGEVIDDVVVTVMRAPRSYTGDRHVRMTQHVLGVKDQQFTEPVWHGASAGLLYNL